MTEPLSMKSLRNLRYRSNSKITVPCTHRGATIEIAKTSCCGPQARFHCAERKVVVYESRCRTCEFHEVGVNSGT